MSSIQLSNELLSDIKKVLTSHDEANADDGVCVQYLAALTGFLTSMLPVDINTKKGMMDDLCGFAHHVLEDSLPTPASAAAAPSGDAFGIWKPE
ncbi:MAG: hypothetical protein KAS48_08585 [Gammaproteobacteria bacterium]|nr:hypothetical protein [Gammaproteobacteria bacterium]MCK5091182.1 hypothetical protein [Gammaproteobacteria bacterium]